MQQIVALVGPTGSGKTVLALKLARRFGMQIVNTDIGLFYRQLSIGVAKPTPSEMHRTRHHLVGFLEIGQTCNLAEYLKTARQKIAQIHSVGELPLIVGGSGQYIWALLEGWMPTAVAPNPELRRVLELELERDGPNALSARLLALNPQIHAATDIRNPRRVVRALERTIGDPDARPSSKPAQPPYRTLVLGLEWDRAELHRRVAKRLELMLRTGWLDELRGLVKKGLVDVSDLPPLIGYRELASHLAGQTTLESAKQAIIVATHRLIRHQHNWFKAQDERITWVRANEAQAQERLAQAIRDFTQS